MNRAEKRRQQKLAKKVANNVKPVQSEKPSPAQQTLTIHQAIDLGLEHHNAGRLPEAESIYQQILQAFPNQPDALHLLGVVAKQLGKNDIAVDLITKALSIKPDFDEAHYNLGNLLRDLGELDKAIASYRKAIDVNPDFDGAHNNLGLCFQNLGKLVEAVTSYQKALAINPKNAHAHDNLGSAFQELGQLDEATACYHKALKIKPSFAKAHRHLTLIKKFSEYDNDVKSMEKAYAMQGLSDEQRMHLAFGLGKAFEDLRQYEKAFDFFVAGNTLKRRECSYSTDNQVNVFKKLKEAFDASLFAKHQGAGCDDETPIFILGMPRSGTTLVEQILASHPHVHGAGELETMNRIVSSHFDKGNGVEFHESIGQVDGADFELMGVEYIQDIRKHSHDIRFITDKMPENFKYIGLIKLMLPNAKMIHCRRDPADTCLSIFKAYFAGKHEYSHDLGELGSYYNLYLGLMEHWHSVIPGFIHDVQYEDMVSDQPGQTRTLLEYCGLEWDDTCLEFYKTDRPVSTASAAQVRKPIYKSSIQSWKRYETQLAPMLEILR